MTQANAAKSRRMAQEVLAIGAICTLAVSARLIFLVRWASTPLFHVPLGDELNFHQTALALMDGKPLDSFLYQPLYSFFLWLVYGIFGVDVGVVRTVQLVIGVGTTLLFYGLGRELGRRLDENAGRWTGRLAGLLAALYGPMIFFEGQMLAPALTVPLTAGALWCLLAAGRNGRSWLVLVAGVLTGLALMGRPNLLFILPAGALWLLWRPWRWKARLVALGLALGGLCLGLSPSWIHNAMQEQEFVLVSSSGGHSFFIGNNPQATGSFHVPRGERIDDTSHQAYRRSLTVMAEKAKGRDLTPSEVSSYWFSRGLDFWAGQPGAALVLAGKKLLLAVNSEERPIHHAYVFGCEIAPELKYLMTFGIIFAFSLMGFFFLWRKLRAVRLMLACAGLYLLSMILFYVADRYRVLMIPMLLPVAAVAMVYLARRVGQVRLHEVWPQLCILGVAFAVSQVPLTSELQRRKALVLGYNLIGKAEGDRGNLHLAEEHFRQAVDLAGPEHGAVVRTNLGLLLERRGALDAARQLYLQAAEASSQWHVVRVRLALMAERRGDYKAAIRWWREVADLMAEPGRALKEIERLEKLIEERK